MELKLVKEFSLNVNADAAWQLLSNTLRVAECMPGAKITEQLNENAFKGTVSVRLGPVSAVFKGDLDIHSCDGSEKKMVMAGKGTDSTGTSATTMELIAWIVDDGNQQCKLMADSTIHINGKLASFGSRMFMPAADLILKQFGDNFLASVQAASQTTAGESVETAKPQQEKSLNGFILIWKALVAWLTKSVPQAFSKQE